MKVRKTRGGTLVEFALVLLLFLGFLLGVTDFSRLLFSWNAANEAARFGARFAAICDDGGADDAAVLARMRGLLPSIATADIQWSPAGCTSSSCESVRVAVTGLNHRWLSPLPLPETLVLPIPGFPTTVPREAMRQDPHSATLCAP